MAQIKYIYDYPWRLTIRLNGTEYLVTHMKISKAIGLYSETFKSVLQRRAQLFPSSFLIHRYTV